MALETQEAQLAAVEASANEAAARVDQVRASLAQVQQALARGEIRAPVAGRVGRRNAEVGMLVGPATVLFELGNVDTVRVEIPLTGQMLARVRPGQPVLIHVAPGAEPVAARLSRVSPFLAAGNFSTTGAIDVTQAADRLPPPGQFVAVDVLYGESEQATLVPSSALFEDPCTVVRGVYVIELAGATLPADAAEPGRDTFAAKLRPVELRGEGRSRRRCCTWAWSCSGRWPCAACRSTCWGQRPARAVDPAPRLLLRRRRGGRRAGAARLGRGPVRPVGRRDEAAHGAGGRGDRRAGQPPRGPARGEPGLRPRQDRGTGVP